MAFYGQYPESVCSFVSFRDTGGLLRRVEGAAVQTCPPKGRWALESSPHSTCPNVWGAAPGEKCAFSSPTKDPRSLAQPNTLFLQKRYLS